MEKQRMEDMPLSAPNAEGNVWPKQVCPAFEPRTNTPSGLRQCWYCRYADFRKSNEIMLENSVCRHVLNQVKTRK